MNDDQTLEQALLRQGVSRRAFLKYCAALASLMAMPASAAPALAEGLAKARRPAVIWLSFQECTGCTESLTRSFYPTLETLIFNMLSLDYHETLMAAAGFQAEAAREAAMARNHGKYLLVVDGSVSTGLDGSYSTVAGHANVDTLKRAAQGAAAIVAVGTCSSFGGIPKANPNPTAARPVSDIVHDKPIINISGCPPIPEVITGVLAQYLTFGAIPELDEHRRPRIFYGNTIHDRCYRRPFYDQGKFAKTFDDEGARNGWCLYELGCKGPTTYNACATVKWNEATSFPIQSGHGCLGCSEPDFWDKGSFYKPLSTPTWSDRAPLAAGAVGGLALGVAAAAVARHRQKRITEEQ